MAAGLLPTYSLAPVEYRLALDAAASALGDGAVAWVCRCAELEGEVLQRFGDPDLTSSRAALLVEPGVAGWRSDLDSLGPRLEPGGRLAVLLSRPLARLLPERARWRGRPLGVALGGVYRLKGGLRGAGLSYLAERGFHSLGAIVLSAGGDLADRAGRPALGDRLRAAARLRYVTQGALATVALVVATKGGR